MEQLLQAINIESIENKELSIGIITLDPISNIEIKDKEREEPGKISRFCDIDEMQRLEAFKPAANVYLTDSLKDILNNQSIEGVVIATPTALHASHSIAALLKGKAVFCQPPLGRTTAETKEVINTAREADRLISVDFPYRYSKAAKALYEVIQSRELGHIFSVDLVFHNSAGPDPTRSSDPSESGGGCLIDLGIHLIDLALWTLGFPKVYHTTSRMFSKGKLITPVHKTVEDFVTARIDLEDNIVMNLNCSWNRAIGKESSITATFHGTNGSVVFKNINGSSTDFVTEKYQANMSEKLIYTSDISNERPTELWANDLSLGQKYSPEAEENIKVAEVIDRLYGR